MTKPEASATYTATRFGYAFNGRAVTFAVGETWDDASVCPPVNYQIMWAREFRYDGARARYLNRQLDPVALMRGSFVSLSDTWTDYDGDEVYGDFTVTPGSPPTVTNRRSYQPGLAQVDPWMSSGSTATDYVMSDHLGTTRGLIAPNNIPTDAAVYTAFGERISGTNHRFGYVRSFGYQASGEFPFLHVGARYYDPASGRFLQRDPIGIEGGLNVYVYTDLIPTHSIDADGLQSREELIAALRNIDRMIEEATQSKAVQRVEELLVERNRLLNELLEKAAKKIGKKIIKKVGGKLFPVAGACFFAYDWYKGGFKHAVREWLPL